MFISDWTKKTQKTFGDVEVVWDVYEYGVVSSRVYQIKEKALKFVVLYFTRDSRKSFLKGEEIAKIVSDQSDVVIITCYKGKHKTNSISSSRFFFDKMNKKKMELLLTVLCNISQTTESKISFDIDDLSNEITGSACHLEVAKYKGHTVQDVKNKIKKYKKCTYDKFCFFIDKDLYMPDVLSLNQILKMNIAYDNCKTYFATWELGSNQSKKSESVVVLGRIASNESK